MATIQNTQATVEDLYLVEGKAELVHGKIETMGPTGENHAIISGVIYISLYNYSKRTGLGRAFPDNTGFLCDLPDRKSFSPDASFYDDRKPRSGRKFLPEPPLFAVEIRSENDYGRMAELKMAEKRQDYFAAGTKAVWDVDPDGPVVIRLYLEGSPESPLEFCRGEIAHAEPILNGWSIPVDEILDEIEN